MPKKAAKAECRGTNKDLRKSKMADINLTVSIKH